MPFHIQWEVNFCDFLEPYVGILWLPCKIYPFSSFLAHVREYCLSNVMERRDNNHFHGTSSDNNHEKRPWRRHSVDSEDTYNGTHRHISEAEKGVSGSPRNAYREFEAMIERKSKEMLQGYFQKLSAATHGMSFSCRGMGCSLLREGG